MLQDIIDWFKLNPPALTALATLLGGLMAAAVAVLTAWMSHHFTAKREEAKALADERREQQKAEREARSARRAVLRAHLERLVACAQQHNRFHLERSRARIKQAFADALNAAAPPLPIAQGVQPLDEAAALATLYFPELDAGVQDLYRATHGLLEYLSDSVPRLAVAAAPMMNDEALSGAAEAKALAAAYDPLLKAERQLLKAARGLIERELLPSR